MKPAILLFAHGARDPEWALPFRAILAAVARGAPDARVELAFLEMMTPTLTDAAEALIAAGATSLTVVPLFMAQGGHLKSDLPLLLDALRSRHPGLAIHLTPAIGDAPELTTAIARWTLATALPPSDEDVLRKALLAQARCLNGSGMSPGTSGNLSVRLGEGFLITPSGQAYEGLSPQDLVWVGFDGRHLHPLEPSSEWRMHRDIYLSRADANAVVHAHPPHCTALAIRHMEIPPLHYMIAVSGGASIRCAAYHTYGTEALSLAALVALEGRNCCLLANHGMVALGPNLARAMWIAEETEALARQYLLTLPIGGPTLLPEDEIARVVEKFRTYGRQA